MSRKHSILAEDLKRLLLNHGVETENDIGLDNEWNVGSKCCVYSNSQKKWCKGTVIYISNDKLMTVRYDAIFEGSVYEKEVDPNGPYIKPYIKTKKGRKKEEEKDEETPRKTSRPRPWKQYEKDYLLKMHKECKSMKVIAEELERTESALKQKLRLLLIEQLTCSACSAKFKSEKALKLHVLNKQDDIHKVLREKNDDNMDKTKKKKKRKISNIVNNNNMDSSITNVNITIQQNLYNKTKKKEETPSKTPRPRPWKQHEKDYVLKMHKENKQIKEICEELERTESAIRQKLRLLLIEREQKEKESLKCSVCSIQFDSGKALKLHQLKKQDAVHKQFREQNNDKMDDQKNDNFDNKTKFKKQEINNNKKIEERGKDKLKWDATECADWIYSLGHDYKQYVGKWKSCNISGDLLNDLNDEDLADFVESRIHRKGILKAWNKI